MIPAFEVLVLTMSKATKQLVYFTVIIVVTMLFATEMDCAINGVYTTAYANFGEAFFVIIDAFANGANFDGTSTAYRYNPFGVGRSVGRSTPG